VDKRIFEFFFPNLKKSSSTASIIIEFEPPSWRVEVGLLDTPAEVPGDRFPLNNALVKSVFSFDF
jgi:hypothetical protein